MYQVRTTYAYPERMALSRDETGRTVPARIPGHPTRPARAHEVNVWWEDVTFDAAVVAHAAGAYLRVVRSDGGVLYHCEQVAALGFGDSLAR